MNKIKSSQWIMLWLLPIIVIGGLFFKWLGFIVLGMMVFFLVLSYFKNRYWCWHLCPRGAFLDIVLSRGSFGRSLPRFYSRQWFRWTVFGLFMAVFAVRLINTRFGALEVGALFVSMCLVTTLIAIVLGIPTKHRAWCVVCPMGTLQNTIGKKSTRRKPRSGGK